MDFEPNPYSGQSGEDLLWARRIALSLTRDEHLSEDLAQDAVEAQLRQPADWEHPNRRGWLATVVRNKATQHFRSLGRRKAREERSHTIEVYEDPAERLARLEVADRVQDAVESLEMDVRAVVRRRFWDGWSIRRIAEEQDTSEATVEYRLQKAKRSLKGHLCQAMDLAPNRLAGFLLPLTTMPLGPVATPPASSAASAGRLWATGIATFAVTLSVVVLLLTDGALDSHAQTSHSLESGEVALVHGDSAVPDDHSPKDIQRSHLQQGLKREDGEVVEIHAVDFADGAPLADTPLRIFHLRHVQADSLDHPDRGRLLYRERTPAWELLQTDDVVTDDQGATSVVPHPDAFQVVAVPGSGSTTHALADSMQMELRASTQEPEGGWSPLHLRLHRRDISITGTVLQSEGQPVPGSELHYWFDISFDRNSKPDLIVPVNADGSFHLPHAAAAGVSVILQPHAPGYVPARQFRHKPGQGERLEDLELHLLKERMVLIQVTNDQSLPIQGVEVMSMPIAKSSKHKADWERWTGARMPSMTTDLAGQALVPAHAGGWTSFILRHPRHESKQARAKPEDDHLEIVMAQNKSFRGRVVDLEGKGVPGAEVKTLTPHPSLPALTDAYGEFAVQVASDLTDFRVHAQHENYGFAWSPLIPAAEDGSIVLPIGQAKEIRGKVAIDADRFNPSVLRCFPFEQMEGARPIGGSWVPASHVSTNPDGSFKIDGLTDGRYLLTYGSIHGDL